MADDSYHRLHAECYKRSNLETVFGNALEEVANRVDYSWVKSCVAFGTGSGEYEMDLARRLLPNLRSFQAVETDPESIKALRVAFQQNQLPGVEASVVETSLENWSGVDNPVDAVLFVNMLAHVHSDDRKALFQKLMTTYLNPTGIVIIVDYVCSVPSGDLILKERLGMLPDDYDVMEKEMLDVGFRVVLTHDLRLWRDLANPSNGVVKFIRMLSDYKCSEQQVRAAIDDIFSQPNMDVCMKKLGIFTR